MKIPEDTIQQVRDATDIVELVSQFVTLKKKGKSYLGLCPFHTEKTPSFNVDPERRFFHCFGCGEGGNAFTFLMKMERISFPDALRRLAERAGIALERYESDPGRDREIENLYHANQVACDFFRACYEKTQGGKKAQRYLENRGFAPGTADRFLVGYAPNLWDGLIQNAGRESLPLELFEKAGLVIPRQNRSGHYDRFRGRLMFPIQNVTGRVIGFGGRALTEGPNIPKYLNSPETPVYQKSQVLYGLSQCQNGIRKRGRLLIVEGYLDLMRLVEAGFDYAVATSGTALTEGHARLITRYTREVTLIFDGDSAGFSAAVKGLEVLLPHGLHVRIAVMPGGHDPDSLIRQEGAPVMERLLEEAQDVVDFLIGRFPGLKSRAPGERAKAAHAILQTLNRMKDPVARNLMIKSAAEKLGVDEQVLFQQTRRLNKQDRTPENTPTHRSVSAVNEAERAILRLLLADPERWGGVFPDMIGPEHFEGVTTRRLFDQFSRARQMNRILTAEDIARESGHDPETAGILSHLLSEEMDPQTDQAQLAIDCILSLRLRTIRARIREKQREIKEWQDQNRDVTEISGAWMEMKKNLAKQRSELLERWKKIIEFGQ